MFNEFVFEGEGLVHKLLFGSSSPGHAALQPHHLLPASASHLIFPWQIPDAKRRRETSFLPALFCLKNILLRVASCPAQL